MTDEEREVYRQRFKAACEETERLMAGWKHERAAAAARVRRGVLYLVEPGRAAPSPMGELSDPVPSLEEIRTNREFIDCLTELRQLRWRVQGLNRRL